MAPLGEPDETLMARTADGDRACLELLVRRHATPLLTFLARSAATAIGRRSCFKRRSWPSG